ncbi:hypothetical protein M1L60_03345 [Actinoplanes sp. TRM 88003]|uniref:Uncharacterized protein n=1 Tax=Paractinoplanes aksuensis TaxID=2939490 RepID=A0ABT1DGK2_9ACTN|nr:hypothetical protein [Actinoplanes aksuensis]MCO8269623.1 hypothetical protein [Actinoplanes aksuensis]
MLTGAVILESLAPGTVLDDTHVQLHKLTRYAIDDNTPEQPQVWTVLEFTSTADPTELAHHFARSLTGRGWYTSYDTDDETFVIFPGQVFHYRTGDTQARAEAETYARAAGVPESQLDW